MTSTVHYPHRLNPAVYPDFERRPFRVPTWATFGGQTQFTTLRSLHQSTWRDDLRRYTEEFKLGRVIWPMTHVLYMPHIDEVLEELRQRDLYLFDLWSYVPGSPMEGMWSNITPPQGMVAHLERVLGDRFLGIDNGEQDGRYVAGYTAQQCPNIQDRRAQYLNFMRHFERLGNELGNHLSALVSLSFGHYFLKEGNHGLLGAETAQALPNSQVYYAFIRGAGRQYGVHWFGNASTFNRWGYKNYEIDGATPDAGGMSACGPDKGASLALLKRLLYSHILYNSVMAGFEMGWIREAKTDTGSRWELTPIGMIQQGAIRWVDEQGDPGTLHAPVALMLDFDAGWTVPRHLYSGEVYKVWGAMPYGPGDYLTHGVLSLLYPGYEDASYYHDERGFLAPTPHGDMTDIVLSDVPVWGLRQYGLVVVAGELNVGAEVRDNLIDFMTGGGHLMVTGENARRLFPELRIGGPRQAFPCGAPVKWADGTEDAERESFETVSADIPSEADILATCGGEPIVFRYPVGKGRCTVLLSPHGLSRTMRVAGPIRNAEDQPLAHPYVLTGHARHAIADALTDQQVFEVGEGLGFITCRKGPGDYTVGVFNNMPVPFPFKIVARRGTIKKMTEIELDQREKGQLGYWPAGMEGFDGGTNSDDMIAAYDVRLFRIRIAEKGVTCLPEVQPPPRPRNRFLALRDLDPVQDAIWRRPTFFQHFDGVKLDARYLRLRDRKQIDRERPWLARQQVRLIVDFCSELNFYPGLTLLDGLPERSAESRETIADVLEKAACLDAADILISLHRQPENHCDADRAAALFETAVRDLCRHAGRHGMTVHLQYHRHRWWGSRWWDGPFNGAARTALAFIERVDAPNLRLALNTGHAAWLEESLADVVAAAGDRLGMLLYSATARDLLGQVYDAHAPVADSGLDLAPMASLTGLPQVLDAVYPDVDAEYRDARTVWPR